jgi:hypothetical protein
VGKSSSLSLRHLRPRLSLFVSLSPSRSLSFYSHPSPLFSSFSFKDDIIIYILTVTIVVLANWELNTVIVQRSVLRLHTPAPLPVALAGLELAILRQRRILHGDTVRLEEFPLLGARQGGFGRGQGRGFD